MKKKYVKVSNWLLSGLLSFIGFNSCNDHLFEKEPPLILEYGTPTAAFEIKGKVIDKNTQAPLPEMRIATDSEELNILFKLDTLKTNQDGKFQVTFGSGNNQGTYRLITRDTLQNYANDTTLVTFKPQDLQDGKGWFIGKATKEVTIEMKKKEDK